jgi:transposase-like protein
MKKQRRVFAPEFKVRVALELLSGQKTLMEAAKEYGIKDSVISRWRTELIERAPSLFTENTQTGRESQQRIAELERMVGKLTMELEMAKKVYGYSSSTSDISERL